MARIKIPTLLSLIVDLFNAVVLKDTADGSGSIIRPTMVENEIVLTTDQTTLNNAVDDNTNFLIQEKLAVQLTGQRNQKYDPKMVFYKGCGQFLKGFYGKNFLSLSDWGFTILTGGKIVYSKNVKDNCDSIQTLITFHLSFATGTSPLLPFLTENNYDVTTIAADLVPTKDLVDAHTAAVVSQTSYRQSRDNNIKIVVGHLRIIAKFLKKNFLAIPQNIGKWGYKVIMEPGDPKETDLALAHAEVKVIYQVIIGSDFVNTKGSILNLFPGKTPTGTAIVIAVGETIIVPKGYSTSTVVNMSSSIIGGINYLKG